MEKNVIERALLCSLFLDQVAILEVVGLLRPEMFPIQIMGLFTKRLPICLTVINGLT